MTEDRKRLPRSMCGDADDFVYLGKVISFEGNEPKFRPTELQLDSKLWDAISQNPAVCRYILSGSKFAERNLTLVTNEKWHQRWYKNSETGKESETDVLLMFEEANTRLRFAIHVENKTLTGRWQPDQAESYRVRAIAQMGKWRYADFELVLIAPSAFVSAHPKQASLFDRSISYEQLSRYIPEFAV